MWRAACLQQKFEQVVFAIGMNVFSSNAFDLLVLELRAMFQLAAYQC